MILFAPTIPLMMAGSLFDRTYKQFNPDSNQSSYGGTFILCLVINSTYVSAGFFYLVWYYIVKNIKSRMGREGAVEKKLRLVDYACLFVVLFMAVLVLVCVLYWIVLGTVLNPEKVVPIMVSVTVFFAAVNKNWALLQKFRRVLVTKIGDMANKAQRLRLKAAAFKTKVTATKTATLVQAHDVKGKGAHELQAKANKLAAVEDKLREVMAQCS